MSRIPAIWTEDGVYTSQQAAALLGVSTAMARRWVYGNSVGKAAIVPQHPEYSGDLMTFLDLIQCMAIRAIRTQKNVSLQKVRETVLKAREKGIPYPLATRHTTYVLAGEVILRLDDGTLIHATGKYHDNELMEEVVEEYLDDVGFNNRGIANAYRPIRKAHRSVILSPAYNYGAPTVVPCGYTVETLLNAVDAEGGPEQAADACGVNPIDVQLALEYECRLLPKAA